MSRRQWISAVVSLLGLLAVFYGPRLRSASFSLEHVEEYTGDGEPAAVEADAADE